MTTQSIFPKDDVEQKPDFPSRTRVDSQGSNYSYSPSPSPTREKAQNHHPYRIKTTSTGILTRSNSSAGTPFSQHSYSPLVSPSAPRTTRSKGHTHRYTKSLSSSNDVFQPPPLPSPTPRSRANSMSRPASQYPDETGLEDDAEIYDRDSSPERPSLVRGLPSSDSESIFGARVRRSETLPSLFTPRVSVTSDPFSELTKELGLPQNPKYWSPTNLSLYIGTVSSVKRGGPLLDHVLRDVQIYLIREKVTGRQFMRVSEVDLDRYVIERFQKHPSFESIPLKLTQFDFDTAGASTHSSRFSSLHRLKSFVSGLSKGASTASTHVLPRLPNYLDSLALPACPTQSRVLLKVKSPFMTALRATMLVRSKLVPRTGWVER